MTDDQQTDDPSVEHFLCPCCGAPMRAMTLWRCESDPELHQWVGNWDDVQEQALGEKATA